jgi:RHS repeat-associated protein
MSFDRRKLIFISALVLLFFPAGRTWAQGLPSGWSNSDIGPVGTAGSASYASGVFTVKGAGQGIGYGSYSDGIQFVYQPLSGDGTIVARVVSLQGTSAQAGVMIRESLNQSATNAYGYYWNASPGMYFNYRTSTGGATANQYGPAATLPYWVKVVRSGSSFSSYASPDGMSWTQMGAARTITMAQNAYIGLAVSSQNTSALATSTFDNVSVSTVTAPAPAITSISATTGSIGSQVTINGSGFGNTQNGSAVLLNNTPVTINTWSNTSISITIPTGATSGYIVVSVAPSMNDSNAIRFTVTAQPLPTSWLDGDVGSVGITGSATYANGVFTVKGAGQGADAWQVSPYADAMHFVYQSLSGDGTIVARVVSAQGQNSQTGVMIRESLDQGATNGYTFWWNAYSYPVFGYRLSTSGAANGIPGSSATLPYWVKMIRNGSTFTGYASPDGVNWIQVGTRQITMAQNVYIGLAVSSYDPSILVTATFDNVSVSSATVPAPVITSVSATTGSIGSQVAITGTGFGATQSGSLVTLNNVPVTINSWSGTSIAVTIPTGATSGYLVVSVAPSMNDSNAVFFAVTSQPLPTSWVNQDVGLVGIAGSATYANGVFTVKGAGQGADAWQVSPYADAMHFVYQSLSGDGTIVARVVSAQGQNSQTGVMIRESLSPGATNGYTFWWNAYSYPVFGYRLSTSGAANAVTGYGATLPYWVKMIRNGSTFTGYASADGVNWTQVGTRQITMAQNVYIGLAVSSYDPSTLVTATFDNVSIRVGSSPLVTSLSPNAGGRGASVTIAGSSFGQTQGTSTVSFNGALASVMSWSSTQIVATVPNNATSGNVVVTVNSIASPSNAPFTVINPVINNLTPPGAQVGAAITLNGSGFGGSQGSNQVKFNGVVAGVNSWSDTAIAVVVPTNATSGPVTVVESGVVSNGVQFTVLSPVSVTSISPNAGPIGTTVTFNGQGFGNTQSNSVAAFYGATATITSWSDAQIVAVVPQGAATGPVTVTVGGMTAQGPSFTLLITVHLTDSFGNTSAYTNLSVGGMWHSLQGQGSGCSSCTQRGNISFTYDSAGNALTRTDELGRTTTYTYDTHNNVLSVSQPTGSGTATTSYTYNSFGEVLTTTDPLGNVTTNTYDANGKLLTVTTPAPGGSASASVTTFTYDSKGELLTIKDPLGHVTTMTYTPAGFIATITDAQNNVTTYGYDAHGNRTSVKDALNNQTTFAYDAGDRLTTITYPSGGGTTTFTYDVRGRRTSVTDQNGKKTTYAYDDADRLTSITDAANNVTTYTYDTENNLTSIQDANLHTTNFTYDAFGRLTRTNFPSSHIETYAYDAVGNLTTKTDRKNQTITYTYDQLNRLAQKLYPDSAAVNYTYDNDSRLTQVTDPTGTYQFTFDNMGRLTNATTNYAFLTGRNFANFYGYDVASNRTSFTDPENGATSYVYDTLNRLQTLTSPQGAFGFSYDALSRRTGLTRPNSVTTNYTYDNLSRLLSVVHQKTGTTLDGATYTVDAAGNRTSKGDLRAGVTSNYTYDAIYELTKAMQGGSTTESYTYDPLGNRLSSLGVPSYTHDSSNELTAKTGTTYTYDYNGNTLAKTDSTGTTTYTWDFENRLKSVTLPGAGGIVSFKYDPFGRRIYKSSSSGTSIYAYDGDGATLIEETNVTGGVVARYAQGLNIDEPLAVLRSGTTSYYQGDGLGSITSLSSAASALNNTYTYDSFGRLTNSTGSLTNPLRYTARDLDAETNLYYYRARYYDPSTGRFISEDPLGFSAGSNFYSYVGNDPTDRVDPLGLFACKDCKTFLRVCYLTAGVTGFAVRWGCRVVCTAALKMPMGCTVLCTIAGGGAAGALQLACYGGYRDCLKKCDPCSPAPERTGASGTF